MAVSVASVLSGTLPYRIVGDQREVITNVTLDSSYEEGGEPLSANQLGLNLVRSAVCQVINGTESSTFRGIAAYYTAATSSVVGKLHLIDAATGKEAASATNAEKVVVQVVAKGV